jgi:hypothetical protein
VKKLTSSLLNIEQLSREEYSPILIGSDRIYYKKYPYKVSLIDTNVSYDVTRALEMLDWWEITGKENVKFVSNLTRHFYFREKKVLDFFVDFFADQIKDIKGPVSQEHIGFLQQVNQNMIDNQNHYHFHGNVELIIRNNLWHKEFDTKVEVSGMKHPPGRQWTHNNGYGRPSLPHERHELQQAIKQSCKGIVDKYRDSRWNYFYCSSNHIDDIKMFVKLKHPQARLHISKALVEKNL